MVREVAEEATSKPALKFVESAVIRYPTLGGGDGAVQEINTVPIPFCLTVRLVGAAEAVSEEQIIMTGSKICLSLSTCFWSYYHSFYVYSVLPYVQNKHNLELGDLV